MNLQPIRGQNGASWPSLCRRFHVLVFFWLHITIVHKREWKQLVLSCELASERWIWFEWTCCFRLFHLKCRLKAVPQAAWQELFPDCDLSDLLNPYLSAQYESIYCILAWVLSGLTLPLSSWPSYLPRLCWRIFIPPRVAEYWLSIWISCTVRCTLSSVTFFLIKPKSPYLYFYLFVHVLAWVAEF